jgi:hypothetical protein
MLSSRALTLLLRILNDSADQPLDSPMSKKRKTYSADELVELKERLLKHRAAIEQTVRSNIAAFRESKSFDDAVDLRDNAQRLVSTCNALDNMDMFITAANREPQSLSFRFEDLGLAPTQ